MTLIIADRIKETSTTTGTGNFTLAGAVAGFRAFSAAVGSGHTTYYVITNRDAASEYEVGYGTMSGSTTLVRTSVIASSNANAAVNFSAGTKDVFVAGTAESSPLPDPGLTEARLTLTTDVPVTSADVTSGNVYLTPFKGNRISLYEGSRWRTFPFSEVYESVANFRTTHATPTGNTTSGSAVVTNVSSTTGLYPGEPVSGTGIATGSVVVSVDSSSQITLSANATSSETGTSLIIYHANYDVFAYLSSGSVAQSFTAWTNNTTRATDLARQDGVYVLSGSANKKYVGTVRLSSNTEVTDSVTKRFLWNYYNQRTRTLAKYETTNYWTYATLNWRYLNGSSANRVEFVLGLDEHPVTFRVLLTLNGYVSAGIGLDVNAPTSPPGLLSYISNAGGTAGAEAFYHDFPGVGYHYLAVLEWAAASTTVYGTHTADGDTIARSGGQGHLYG